MTSIKIHAERTGFDELFQADGTVRKQYRQVYDYWRAIPKPRKALIRSASKVLFDGDYRLDPLPRIITRSEFSVLSAGVEQRGTAILHFLRDYYRGEKRWKKVIPSSTLKAILDRNGTRSVLGKLDPNSISFPYGPDIIRDAEGQWRVVEDSAGCLGGFGDILESRKILRQLVPAYSPFLRNAANPIKFYEKLTSHYKAEARKKDGIALLFLQDFEHESDHETRRLAKIFKSFGIRIATDDNPRTNIIIDDNAAYLKRGRNLERIGYLILHVGPEDIDHRRLCLELRKCIKNGIDSNGINALKRMKFHSIRKTILENKILTNFSPGTQFVNDKMFGLFVDRLIRFYLKQDPILKRIPAKAFAYRNGRGQWKADRALLNQVFRRKDDFVIKRVDEDGGSGVWIGQKEPRGDFDKLRPRIIERPECYIVQEFTHLSVLEDRIVDLRLHAQISPGGVIVNNTPWGRANWVHGDGKVNIGQHGFTSPVVVR